MTDDPERASNGYPYDRDPFLRAVVAELKPENVRWPGLWIRLESLLNEHERLVEQFEALRRTTYDMTPVDCLISELRDGYLGGNTHSLTTRAQFEERVAQFKAEVSTPAKRTT